MLSKIAFQKANAVSWKCSIKKTSLKMSQNLEAATGGVL